MLFRSTLKNKKEKYVVWILVTPYVKRYLLTNFAVKDSNWDNLVNISSDKHLDIVFRSRLFKPSNRYDKRISENNTYKYRSERIALEISKADFDSLGWALSPTDEAAISRAFELRCRTLLLTYLAAAYMVTPNLSACIQSFYDAYHFDDESWPADSIRRIWNRDTTIDKEALLKNNLHENINKIVAVQMFRNGTISQQGYNAYANN